MECVECGRPLDAPARTGRPRRYCSRACQGRAYRRRRDDGRLAEPSRATPGDARSRTLVQVAVATADADGVEAVTLRSVAHRAGLALAVVRRDVGSRDRLVASMVQHVLVTRPAPHIDPGDDPVDALTRLAEAEWATYAAHPWLVGVLASTRPPLVPAVLAAARAVVEVLERSGLDARTALDRYLALSAYVQGMAMLLLAEHREARTGTSHRAWWRDTQERLDRTGATLRHPWIVDHGPDSPLDVAATFRAGLRRVVPALVPAATA